MLIFIVDTLERAEAQQYDVNAILVVTSRSAWICGFSSISYFAMDTFNAITTSSADLKKKNSFFITICLICVKFMNRIKQCLIDELEVKYFNVHRISRLWTKFIGHRGVIIMRRENLVVSKQIPFVWLLDHFSSRHIWCKHSLISFNDREI